MGLGLRGRGRFRIIINLSLCVISHWTELSSDKYIFLLCESCVCKIKEFKGLKRPCSKITYVHHHAGATYNLFLSPQELNPTRLTLRCKSAAERYDQVRILGNSIPKE